jgi:hypothetical protein
MEIINVHYKRIFIVIKKILKYKFNLFVPLLQ